MRCTRGRGNALLQAGCFAACEDLSTWGTVENLALGSSQPRDVPAVGCIHIPSGEVCAGGAFIAFGGPQGHDDRLARGALWVRPIGRALWAGPAASCHAHFVCGDAPLPFPIAFCMLPRESRMPSSSRFLAADSISAPATVSSGNPKEAPVPFILWPITPMVS